VSKFAKDIIDPQNVKHYRDAAMDMAHGTEVLERDFTEMSVGQAREVLLMAKQAAEEQLKNTNLMLAELDGWKPVQPVLCDLCPEVAVWSHPAGGFRCNACPRPSEKKN